MAPYIICFIFTGIFSFFNEHNIKRNEKILSLITATFIILVPAILAGVRSYTVGTDVNIYIKPTFDFARSFNSLKDWMGIFGNSMYITGNFEKGFLLLAYFASRISGNAHVFLFLIAILVDLFVYLSLYKLRNSCSIFIGEMIYLLTEYNASYNMARQSIAMSICLFAVATLLSNEKRKYLKFIIWIIIADQFHNSAIISFIFLFIYLIFKNDEKEISLKQISLCMILFAVGTFFVPILQYLNNIGLLKSHYLGYVGSMGDEVITAYSSNSFFILCLFIYSISYIVLLLGKKYLGKQKNFFIAVALMDILFMSLSNTSFYLYRIAAYFLFIRILSLSQKSLYESKYKRNILSNSYFLFFDTIFLSIVYFVFFIGILNWHYTVPYIFMNN